MYEQYVPGDQESLATTSSNYPQSWASSSPLGSPTSVLPPSDSAVQLNQMYLEAKKEMLEVIEEGLQLKLEIQGIKDQFLHLIHDFDEFEQKEHQFTLNMPHGVMEQAGMKPSSVRTRVRTLYEARKARIRARRPNLAEGKLPEMGGNLLAPPAKVPKVHLEDDCDKENSYRLPIRSKSEKQSDFIDSFSALTSTPMVGSSQVPLRAMTWSVRRFLTPIKEEFHDESLTSHCLPRNFLIPKSNSKHKKASSKSTQRRKNIPEDSGDYVTLRTLNNDLGDYVSLSPDAKKHGRHRQKRSPRPTSVCVTDLEKPKCVLRDSPRTPRNRPQSTGDMIRDVDVRLSPMDFTLMPTSPLRDSSSTNIRSPTAMCSPIQSATSDAINELYTSRALKDLSLISQASKSESREHVSSANLSGAFHSTFNYPLHSTMNYPLHSTFSLSDDNTAKVNEEDGSTSDTRTTLSEPSTVISRRSRRKLQPLLSIPVHSDSNMNQHPQNTTMPSETGETNELIFSPSSYKTPTKKPEANLCKEHGIHPTFDGSCLFRSDDSNLNSTDDDLDRDENGNTPKAKINITETDCDSSYLSECVDDLHYSIDVDDFIATYDSRTACIRMLKRQTGQVELQDPVKYPIGMSESDLHCEVTKEHLSLEATRASLPDLSGLSTLPGSQDADDDDRSESTLHASSPRKSRAGSILHESDDLLSPNDTLVSTDKRPLSVSTNDDSPASNTGISVPVNSPNITDSGGSSSRQNTDNYEYLEKLHEEPQPNIDRISLPGSHTTHSSRSRHSHKAPSTRSHHSHRTSKSHQPHQPSKWGYHCLRRQYSSTPDTRATRPTKTRSSRDTQCTRTRRSSSSRESHDIQTQSRARSNDWDSGCSSHEDRAQSSRHFTVMDNTGRRRTIVQHPPVSQNLPQERKKALVKKLKHFSNSFYKATSTGNLQIETLGHF